MSEEYTLFLQPCHVVWISPYAMHFWDVYVCIQFLDGFVSNGKIMTKYIFSRVYFDARQISGETKQMLFEVYKYMA